jgi:hypothetical protein
MGEQEAESGQKVRMKGDNFKRSSLFIYSKNKFSRAFD